MAKVHAERCVVFLLSSNDDKVKDKLTVAWYDPIQDFIRGQHITKTNKIKRRSNIHLIGLRLAQV